MTIGERIKLFRKEKKLTQKQLGELCGYEGRSAELQVQHWEHGRSLPALDKLRPLAEALGVTLEQLIP